MGCNCGGRRATRTPYPGPVTGPAPGEAPIASGGQPPAKRPTAPRYELTASGAPQQFNTRLEADAARVRQGGRGIIREL